VVAAKLLADAVAKSGYQAQSFASYGALRRGEKVESYVRISDTQILVHSKMYEPDYLIIMDESFTQEPEAVSGVKEKGEVLINTPELPEAFSSLRNFRIVTIDANRIAASHGLQLPSGMPIINTAVLGAIAGMIPSVSIEQLAEAIREGKLPAAEKNIKAAEEAYHWVKSQLAGTIVSEVKEEAPRVSVERYPVYQNKMPPCQANCPAGEAIQTTISLIQSHRFEEALENIKAENPFPGICGRVCFHPCQTHCNRNEFDEAVAINALERAVFDYADANAVRKPIKKAKTGRRVAIIGSGPAGMTCAYFLAILGHDVTVFEALPVLGGIPRVGIPAYRLPRGVVEREIRKIIDLGIEVRTNTEVGKDISFENIAKKHDACFIATGARRSMSLNIPGESSNGVILGLDFLKGVAFGRGVDLGIKVAVIGGGNTAVDAARTAKRLGAEEVAIIYRRSATEMPAYPAEVAAAKAEGVRLLYLTMPVQIHSNGKRVAKLECMKTRLGRREKDGRRRPQPVEGTNFTVDVDTVIAAVGETLEAPFLPGAIEMEGGLIKVDYLGRTSMKGVYAGGDATTLSRSVVEAIASGKKAALGIDIFLTGTDEKIFTALHKAGGGAISMSRYLAGDYSSEDSSVVSFKDLNTGYFFQSPRARAAELPAATRASNFDEVSPGLSQTQAMVEVERCFHCGHCNLCENCYIFCPDVAITFDEQAFSFVINRQLCARCGICVEECPCDAISWEWGTDD
jgi:2-oxoacid:acceptor oxidoreductase gamma subunit (pyruvate/2-ketoisovalerate family)